MMHDNLDPREGIEPTASRQPEAAGDQEVPMMSAKVPAAVHAWLDGEPVTEAALNAAPREVALWKSIEAETSVRRRMVTPAHVQAQILAKLPEKK
jgi:hypothetical protein